MTDDPHVQGPVLVCRHPGLSPGHLHGDVPAEGPPAGHGQGQQGGGKACSTPAKVLSQVMEQFYSQEDGSGDSTVNLSTLSLFSGNEGLNKIPAEDSLSDHKQVLLSIVTYQFKPNRSNIERLSPD